MSDSVLYSDVVTKTRERTNDLSSSLTETTYSEVNISKMQPWLEPPAASQQVVLSNRGSIFRSERGALLVCSVLLIAAVIGFGVFSFYYIKIHKLQSIENKFKAQKNLTERPSAKCERCWEHHGGKCYYFSNRLLTWKESKDECNRQGGDLVKIDSREEQEYLDETVRKEMIHDEPKFWIGLTDSVNEGKWVWIDGSQLNESLAFWIQGEPSNYLGENHDGEDCARMGERAGAAHLKNWHDRNCNGQEKSICEKPAGSGL